MAALAILLFAYRATAAGPLPLAIRVSQAPSGAVIRVGTGVHRVNLLINKPLTLIGGRGAILDGGGKKDVVRIGASHVTVRHLIIRHSGRDLTAMNAGVYVEKQARDVTIADNTLPDDLFGIYLDGAKNVRVLNNRIIGISTLRRPDRGDGIHLWDDTGVLVQDNDIAHTRDGIYIYVSPRDRLIGNRIHDVRYGIHWMFSNHDVAECNLTFDDTAGYALMDSDHLEIRDNRSRGDLTYGILMNYITHSHIVGNCVSGVKGEPGATGQTVPGASGKGLFVYNSEFNVFRSNTIKRCPIGIHFTGGSNHNRIYDNAFIHNRIQVKYVQNYRQKWSFKNTGNYWSDYLGWDLNGDGSGDIPYYPVSGVDRLLWKFPTADLLMSSPAILVLRYVQRAFPVFTPPQIEDAYPLMRPPAERRVASLCSKGGRRHGRR